MVWSRAQWICIQEWYNSFVLKCQYLKYTKNYVLGDYGNQWRNVLDVNFEMGHKVCSLVVLKAKWTIRLQEHRPELQKPGQEIWKGECCGHYPTPERDWIPGLTLSPIPPHTPWLSRQVTFYKADGFSHRPMSVSSLGESPTPVGSPRLYKHLLSQPPWNSRTTRVRPIGGSGPHCNFNGPSSGPWNHLRWGLTKKLSQTQGGVQP